MTTVFLQADDDDKNTLADIRVAAMRESLEAVGRFDPVRARDRLLSRFNASNTSKILVDGELVGFYTSKLSKDCLWVDDLYIHPSRQGEGLGTDVIDRLKRQSAQLALPIRLGALRDSPANRFYLSHGFVATHEDAWDIFYQFSAS